MGSTKSKRRNKNEFKKVYPYVRRRPVYTYELDKEAIIETAKVPFLNSSEEIYSLTETYPAAPEVTATAYDEAGGNVNVNVFISSISTTSVTISTSEEFTGYVNIHIVYVG